MNAGKCELDMVLPSQSFCRGLAIQGTLKYVPIHSFRVMYISVELDYVLRSEIYQQEMKRHVDSDGHEHVYFSYKIQPYSEYSTVVSCTPLDERENGGVIFDAPVEIPFTLPLPWSDAHSSLRSFRNNKNSCGVTYLLRAAVYDAYQEAVKTISRNVNIYSLVAFPDPEKPLMVFGNFMSTILCCLPVNLMTLFCITDKTVYSPGDQVLLKYWLQSSKPETIPEIRAAVVGVKILLTTGLKVNYVYQDSEKPKPVTITRDVYVQPVTHPVVTTAQQVSVRLPADCGPPTRTYNGPLKWSYKVYVKLQFKRLIFRELEVELPIVINGKSAEQFDQVIASQIRTARLSDETVAAQQYYANNTGSSLVHPEPQPVVAEAVIVNN